MKTKTTHEATINLYSSEKFSLFCNFTSTWYKRIIREANEKIGSKDFELLPIDEINEDDMLTPKEFQKAVNAAIQLDTQKPVIDDNGGEYSMKIHNHLLLL